MAEFEDRLDLAVISRVGYPARRDLSPVPEVCWPISSNDGPVDAA